jgi:hypothetical protein
MGAVLSQLQTLRLAIKTIYKANSTIQEVLQRASQSPGLPVPNSSPSYWLEDPPHPELVHVQSPELPKSADIVIIGSGITGAAVARSVLQEWARRAEKDKDADTQADTGPPRVVVLEARSLCSGATGRNGGHIKSSPHELFALLKATYGPERAAALTRFQLAHLKALTELCAAEGWDVAECREVESCDVYLDEKDRDAAFKLVDELKEWFPEVEVKTWDALAAREVRLICELSCVETRC